MSARILIYSYIFSLNLSRDCSTGISCPGDQSVHHLVTKWIAFATPALRIFQEMRGWAGRCKKCPATRLYSISLHFNQLFWKLVVVEGWGFIFFKTQTNFCVLLKISVLQRGGWFLLSMCWDFVRNRARFKQILPESQVVTLQDLRSINTKDYRLCNRDGN